MKTSPRQSSSRTSSSSTDDEKAEAKAGIHDNEKAEKTASSDKFIQKALKRPGALTKKANKAGMTPLEFARAHQSDKSLTGQQSRFLLNVLHGRHK
jgi:hypothetical protein